jgi:cyclophilin family peptidyl-prolyl cis-trans isomerase
MIRTTLAVLTALVATACSPKSGTPSPDPAAPDSFDVTMETTVGTITVRSRRAWAPNGVDRFHRLVSEGFYNDVRFFRVVPGWVVQFGLSGDPKETAKWEAAPILDDTVKVTNKRGTLVFARAGQNSRTSQLFFNLVDNGMILDMADGFGFPPIAEITSGIEVIDRIFAGYGEAPNQMQIMAQGDAYLKEAFPKLDGIVSAKVTAHWP